MKIFRILFGLFLFGVVYYSLVFSKKGNSTTSGIPKVQAGYETYSSETDFSQYSGDDIVLFFHAQWCSSCEAIDKNILENGVPDGLKILKVNFDTENEVLDKYGVLTQSSFAQIDASGELIKRRVGGFGIDDIVEKLEESDEEKPWEKIRKENTMIDTNEPAQKQTAYFAGGCFWCMEGPFESLDGVEKVISGYAGGAEETANYKDVGSGKTKDREAVEIVFNPAIIDFETLVETFRYQIDPTDAGGQFGDRGYQYTTAIYYTNDTEKNLAERSKSTLDDSGKFDKDIAVLIEPFTTFFPAEDEHQNYYLTNSAHYNRYKTGSGRAGFIDENREEEKEQAAQKIQSEKSADTSQDTSKTVSLVGQYTGKNPESLSDLERKVVFEQGTEPPFQNKYRDNKAAGIYVDILDGTPLFSSSDKFDSGTGWPSFTKPIDQKTVKETNDLSYGMIRTEVETDSDTHLGHVFNDGPGGGQRYCINSAALDFIPLEKMEELGYGEYLGLFE